MPCFSTAATDDIGSSKVIFISGRGTSTISTPPETALACTDANDNNDKKVSEINIIENKTTEQKNMKDDKDDLKEAKEDIMCDLKSDTK